MSGPPKVSGKSQDQKLKDLIEQHTRLEVGVRLGLLPLDVPPIGGLSHANDMADLIDKMRELMFGTSDILVLAAKFGYKTEKRK